MIGTLRLGIFLICCGVFLSSRTVGFSVVQSPNEELFYPNFTDNLRIDPEMKEAMKPYLLPLSHSAKPFLDYIFSRSRAIESEPALVSAGFCVLFSQKETCIEIAKHPLTPDYIYKIYLDNETHMKNDLPGWKRLTIRCLVAKKMKDIIAEKQMRHFIVADKWLYPLPILPKSRAIASHPVILLAKDMDIYPKEESLRAWKTLITKEHLDELYYLMSRGYGSTGLPRNVPYSRCGKFVFIDTEYDIGQKELRLERVKKYLSPEMQQYWGDVITRKN
jgi:hypothetical protein